MFQSDTEALIALLRERGKTLGVAESCTGGMIGATITDFPGCSEVFKGSAVTYSNESKMALLGVSEDTLIQHGAVSAETAKEMALGASRIYASDYSVAVTGIAGPGGATDTKPVGLVYIAVSDGSRAVATRNIFDGGRSDVRQQAVTEAFRLLIDMIRGLL